MEITYFLLKLYNNILKSQEASFRETEAKMEMKANFEEGKLH